MTQGPKAAPMRSQSHMLLVAAARLEAEYGNPKLIADLREAAGAAARKRAEGRDHSPEDQKRIDRQRTLMAQNTNGPAKAALLDAMQRRAYDLMWDGHTEACDAVTEWLPSDMVNQMFDAWENDQDSKNPRSKFYEPKP